MEELIRQTPRSIQKGFGMNLIEMTASQLEAKMDINYEHGLSYNIYFDEEMS